ncbi:hypothetical protein MTO96_002921 [Rhipicephalus appendiculatus]
MSMFGGISSKAANCESPEEVQRRVDGSPRKYLIIRGGLLPRSHSNVAPFQRCHAAKSADGAVASVALMAVAAESISGPVLPEGIEARAAARLSGPRCVIDHPADSPVRNSFITARARHTPDSRADRASPPGCCCCSMHPACIALRNSCSLSASLDVLPRG